MTGHPHETRHGRPWPHALELPKRQADGQVRVVGRRVRGRRRRGDAPPRCGRRSRHRFHTERSGDRRRRKVDRRAWQGRRCRAGEVAQVPASRGGRLAGLRPMVGIHGDRHGHGHWSLPGADHDGHGQACPRHEAGGDQQAQRECDQRQRDEHASPFRPLSHALQHAPGPIMVLPQCHAAWWGLPWRVCGLAVVRSLTPPSKAALLFLVSQPVGRDTSAPFTRFQGFLSIRTPRQNVCCRERWIGSRMAN